LLLAIAGSAFFWRRVALPLAEYSNEDFQKKRGAPATNQIPLIEYLMLLLAIAGSAFFWRRVALPLASTN
jgi:hypothetical protein